MATVTPGYTFSSNEVVTPTKLTAAATPVVAVTDNEITESKLANNAVTSAKIAVDAVTEAKIANGSVTASKLAAGAVPIAIPSGAILPFAMNSAPSGWLEANGAEYSKTGTYAVLFAAIGTTYGETNGSGGVGTSHFRVPDLRGLFVRGIDSSRGLDANRSFGTYQADAFQGHRHSLLANTFLINNASANWIQGGTPNVSNTTTGIGNPSTDETNGTPRTADETRPKNIALLYCIKT
jgi:microcystin-dependent protein